MKKFWIPLALIMLVISLLHGAVVDANGVDTGQDYCYDTSGQPMPCPAPGEALFGQDASYQRPAPAYQDNSDGTVTDLNTGLMWQQTPGEKISWAAAFTSAEALTLGGYDDWRVPTITELYSLMDFNGVTGMDESSATPYIDTNYFDFSYGDPSAGERIIDAQYWSSTEYVSTVMNGMHTVFGVNFADGRIKGYGTGDPRGGENAMFVRYVRGSSDYDSHAFVDNGDGTVTDQVSGLTWMQDDSGAFDAASQGGMNWEAALNFCETLDFAGYSDWRLPDAKELQQLVDYTRSPDTTGSAAIDPVFNTTMITNGLGQPDYPYFWTGTTHLDGRNYAVYIAFGEAQGYMEQPPNSGSTTLMDVHGAGAQRSDPKTGNAADYPTGHGPQGDVIRINNYVRCVRGGDVTIFTGGDPSQAPMVDLPPQGGQTGQPPSQGSGQQGEGQPPQEAINACSGLNTGEACSFNTPNGTINGTCNMIQNQLACVPAGSPPRP